MFVNQTQEFRNGKIYLNIDHTCYLPVIIQFVSCSSLIGHLLLVISTPIKINGVGNGLEDAVDETYLLFS